MYNILELFFAGIWKLIWDWVLGFGIVGVLLFAAFGTQLVSLIPLVGPAIAEALKPLRYELVWIAVCISAALAWGAHLQADEAARCAAKTVVITKQVDRAVTTAHTKATKKGYKDPFDNPSN